MPFEKLITGNSTPWEVREALRDLQLRVGAVDGRPVWNDLEVSLSSAKVPAAGGPTWTKMLDDGSGSTGVYAWAFAKAATENLYFSKQVHHDHAIGTDLQPHIHFSVPDTGSGNILWEIEYAIAEIGGAFPANSTLVQVLADAHRLQETVTAYNHSLVGWDPDIEVPQQVGSGVSAMIVGRVARIGGDASDTYDDVAFGLSVDFHMAIDGLGSDSATSKSATFPD